MDGLYEHEKKRTYFVTMIQVGIYIPLLIGLFILYPWLAGKYKVNYSKKNEDTDDDDDDDGENESKELLSVNSK